MFDRNGIEFITGDAAYELKVGDKVGVIEERYNANVNYYVFHVTKVTKTQVTLAQAYRFLRRSGSEVGRSHGDYPYKRIVKLNDEFKSRWHRQKAIHTLQRADYTNLETTTLLQLVDVLVADPNYAGKK